jgi:hypothetical protein
MTGSNSGEGEGGQTGCLVGNVLLGEKGRLDGSGVSLTGSRKGITVLRLSGAPISMVYSTMTTE